jgi:hypothetical protein
MQSPLRGQKAVLSILQPSDRLYRLRFFVIFSVPSGKYWDFFFLSNGSTAPRGPRPLIFRSFAITHLLDTPQSVGLFWTSDQPDAETST